jgi:reverse transcriptase-like protein
MQSPLGYNSDTHTVKRLQKSLYGLKQAGQKWYNTLSHALISLRFCITNADLGVFFTYMDKHVLMLAVHMDDCIFTGSSKELIALYKQKLNGCYALTDLEPMHWLLGIKVTHN